MPSPGPPGGSSSPSSLLGLVLVRLHRDLYQDPVLDAKYSNKVHKGWQVDGRYYLAGGSLRLHWLHLRALFSGVQLRNQ
jgi:hypothetical protein